MMATLDNNVQVRRGYLLESNPRLNWIASTLRSKGWDATGVDYRANTLFMELKSVRLENV